MLQCVHIRIRGGYQASGTVPCKAAAQLFHFLHLEGSSPCCTMSVYALTQACADMFSLGWAFQVQEVQQPCSSLHWAILLAAWGGTQCLTACQCLFQIMLLALAP